MFLDSPNAGAQQQEQKSAWMDLPGMYFLFLEKWQWEKGQAAFCLSPAELRDTSKFMHQQEWGRKVSYQIHQSLTTEMTILETRASRASLCHSPHPIPGLWLRTILMSLELLGAKFTRGEKKQSNRISLGLSGKMGVSASPHAVRRAQQVHSEVPTWPDAIKQTTHALAFPGTAARLKGNFPGKN